MQCPTCTAINAQSATVCASCGSPLGSAPPATGTAVPFSPSLPSNARLRDGAYAVSTVLGQGGFGITYKGGDMQLRRYVAIKEFFPYGSQRQGTTVYPPAGVTQDGYAQAQRGFVQEAMTLAKFDHPGIVRVFGAFEENNTAYMVMELLEGKSLQKALEEKGVLPEKEAVRVITQIGAALSIVHSAKLLHRDIKPDNIILVGQGTPEERAVLIDFGTAREFAADKTKTMTAMVTHGYAPLEQYGKQAKFGPYTDVYALGATLYHCLTGQLPVSAMDRLSGVELPPPDRVNPNVSRAVSDAVMWALQVKAPDRPQSVTAWTEALRTGRVPGVLPAATPQVPAAPGSALQGSAWQTPVTPPPLPPSVPPPLPTAAGSGSAVGGSAVGGNAAGTASYNRFCPHCGSQVSLYVTVCPVCHRDTNVAAGSQKLPWWKEKATSAGARDVDRFNWGGGLIALALIILIASAALFYGHNEAQHLMPDDNSTDTSTGAPPDNTTVAPTPAPAPEVAMTGPDAYDAACDFMKRRLNRPDSATFLPFSNSHCDVTEQSPNLWKISSAGSAIDNDGDKLYFAWEATITYTPSTHMWEGTTKITNTSY